MAESVSLTVPAQGVPATPRWVVQEINIVRGYVSIGATITSDPTRSLIRVGLIGENGQTKTIEWNGATADTLIVSLNKLNLTPPNTLNKRLFDRAIADGKLDGTSGGSAD